MNPCRTNRTRILVAGLTTTALTGLGMGLGTGLGIGLGTEVAHAASLAPAPVHTCDGRTATIVGTDGDDTITGTDGDDVIWAGPGDDVVHAGPGDDVVCGNLGADLLVGGAGNDRILGGQDGLHFGRGGPYLVGDTLHGGLGDDYLDVGVDDRAAGDGSGGNTVSYSTSRTAVSVDLGESSGTGEGADTIVLRPRFELVGSSYDDTLVGSSGPDTIYGGPGDDGISGLAGDDDLEAESNDYDPSQVDDDVLDGGPGDDFLRSYFGHDVQRGGTGNDSLISFSDHPAELSGDAGDDDLYTQVTRTSGYVVDGGSGDDTVGLGRTDARDADGPPPGSQHPLGRVDLTAGTISVAWLPSASTGTITSAEHVTLDDFLPWNVIGTAGDDDITGGYHYRLHASMRMGDDTVGGSGVDDVVNGGPGDDTVDGREGDDVCTNTEHRFSCSAGAGAAPAGSRPSGAVLRGQDAGVVEPAVALRARDPRADASSRSCDGRQATIVGTDRNDTIIGTDGDDVIVAGPGNDLVRAGKGDDVVCGNQGSDLLIGGAGNDRVFGQMDGFGEDHGGEVLYGDTLHGGPGDDYLDVGVDDRDYSDYGDRVSWHGSKTGIHLDMALRTATGEGADVIVARPKTVYVGSTRDDTLTGSEEGDNFQGGAGDDTFDGRGGGDQFYTEYAPSDINAPRPWEDHFGDGPQPYDEDVVNGGDGPDFVVSRVGPDVVHGGEGDDTIQSPHGLAQIYGDDGDDDLGFPLAHRSGFVVDAGAGDDRVHAESVSPYSEQDGPHASLDLTAGTLRVEWPGETAVGRVLGAEHVTLDGTARWSVIGSPGDDEILDYEGTQPLHASMREGDDQVQGSPLDDDVNSGPGDDTVHGNAGADICTNTEHRDSCEPS